MNLLIRAYVAAGLTTREQILEYAKLRGNASYLQALSAINESTGSIIRLLGFNKEVAEEISRVFGPFDYPAARLMLSVGGGKYTDELKNGFEDLDLMKSILEDIIGDVIDAIGANSANDEYIDPADLKSFLQRNQSILPNLNTTPPGPASIEIAKQATLLKKKSIKQLRVLVPLKDNWNWVDLGCSVDGAEGVEMQNCGHDFAGNLVSLRDEFNNPHITMTYRESDNTVYQVKGKQNTYPARKYWWAIEKFFEKTGAKLEDRWLSTQALDHPDAKELIDVIRTQALLHPDYGKTKSESLFREDVRQNSTAMVIVSGDPPGKNVTDMIRRLVVDRTKLIVVAQSSSLGPGDFERLLRASMPDVEKKLRIMDDGNSVADAVSSAERNRHYRPSQALEVFCSKEQADAFTQEIRAGSLKFDPTVIAVSPMEIPTDDVGAITSAISGEDLQAMHRVLDPHIFSNQGSLQIYKNLLKGQKTESLLRESSGLKRVYHGSNARIAAPQDPLTVRRGFGRGMDYGPGMYFTTSQRDAARYGSNVYQANVDLKNPMVITSEMSPEMDRFRKAFQIFDEDLTFGGEGLWHSIMSHVFVSIDMGETSRGKVIALIKRMGHDGIIVPAAVVRESQHGSSATGDYVIAFDPSQITDWESVTEVLPTGKKAPKNEGIKQKFPGQQMYVHFSSREKPPQVPNRAINKFAGGSGPIGIYAYPLDAQFSFAADRQFAFVLKPKVEVLNTRTYTSAQLQVDIERLSKMVDLKRPNKLWLRFKDEAVNTGPPFYQLWYLISRIPRPDEEFPIGATGTGFGDPQKGRDLFIQLGYTAIEDSIGIIYGTEPKQILFLTDESFEVVDLVQNLETFRDHASQKSLVESVAGKICSLCEEPFTREEFVSLLTKQKISGVVARIRKTVEHEFKYLEEELSIQDAADRGRFIKGRIKNVLWAVDDEKLTADTIPEQEIKKTVHDLVAKLQKIIAAECQEIERGLDIRDPKASWSFIQPRIQNITSAINSEKPVDESILRESAGPIRVYHGTNRRIDTPQDPVAVKAMMSGMDYGPGMYFTTSPRDAKEYGFNLYQADVDFKNPLVISSEMSPEMDKFRKSFDIGEEEMEFTDEGVWHCIMGFVISLIDAGLTSKKKVIDTIRKLGHDGIIVPAAVVRESKHGSSVAGDYVIVFDPSQITNWGEATAAAMLSRKKESITEQDIGSQDNFLNQVKLGTINWDFREKSDGQSPAEGGFKAWSKKIKTGGPRFVCAVAVLTTVGFSKLTGRGSINAQGWIVDTEIYQYGEGPRKWFYHNEKRLPTPEAAQAYAERIKSFIDSKTLSELLAAPKSGKISMSKFEQIQRFGTLHEFLSDIAPTRELGISKLRAILMDRMGDNFDELEYLGSGRNGSAYRTIEGPVLKITTDREEAKSANTLRGKKCEYIYHVHSVTQVSEGVWLILQEGDLQKLPEEYCAEFDTAVEILETIGAGEALRTGDVDSILEIMIKSEHVDLCDLVTEVMEKFCMSGMLAEIASLGLSADFHSGNIKLRNGCPVLTDLGTPGEDHNMGKKVNQTGSRRVIEFTGMQSAGSAGQMRSSNSSAWAGGRMVLSKPEQHVPEDENATERDNALDQDIVGGGLDWGQGRRNNSSF